ncbi:MAG: FISUMP domain-containing protein [Bacteroidales bacterium]|jgi:uncharacterized protein (TIGR02145 family)|nr:FISUMP domain-containing protein [Bacteroidales bacterium]
MKTTTIFKLIGYLILVSVLIFVTGCEEEQNQIPTCEILYPVNNHVYQLWGEMEISIYAYDKDGQVESVVLFLDDKQIASLTTTPFAYICDLSTVSAGIHTLEAIVYDNAEGMASEKITFRLTGLKPDAKFQSFEGRILQGEEVQFTDLSEYLPSNWHWDFGDGETSTEQNPMHTFNHSGKFNVKLYTENQYGVDSIIKTNLIEVIDTLVTDYDGNVYPVVRIGNQFWMAENLKTTHYADGTPISNGTGVGDTEGDYTSKYYFAYNDDENNVDTYGRLYSWPAIVNGEGVNEGALYGVQGVCPDNWIVPSKVQWLVLINYLGGVEIAGGKLKSTGYDYWNYPNAGASNESGFNALPGGLRAFTYFNGLNVKAFFGSSISDYSSTFSLELIYNDVIADDNDFSFKNRGVSVRCIKK